MLKKILIIGLDGASWRILKPLLSEAKMPYLEKIMKEGASGILDSGLPCYTPSAWASFLTGTNPGKHGIFDFCHRDPQHPWQRKVHDAGTIAGEKLWQILPRHGKRLGLINIPMSYPAYPVQEGFIIPGMLTPPTDTQPVHPKSLWKALKERIPAYEFEIDAKPFEAGNEKPTDFLERIFKISEQHLQASLYCIKEFELDLFMLVLVGTDRIQHFFWHYLDPQHPYFKNAPEQETITKKIQDYFVWLDSAIAELIKAASADLVIILSDHGFRPLKKEISLNKWLENNGFLTYKKENFQQKLLGSYSFQKFLTRLDLFNLRKFVPRSKRSALISSALDPINWEKTVAFSGSREEGGIFLNRTRSDISPDKELSLLNEITRELAQAYDPISGKTLFSAILNKNEVFRGPFLDYAPDLLVYPSEGYELYEAGSSSQMLKEAGKRTGTHEREGIFILHGGTIQSGLENLQANITDILPTILYLWEKPIPDYMDGKPIKTALKPEIKDKLTESIETANQDQFFPKQATSSYNSEEEEKIKERLKSLGYLE